MIPTEVQRILLLVGLAATGYLMLLAWNEDYLQGASTPSTDATEISEQTSSSDIPSDISSDVPEFGQPRQGSSDVPDAALIGSGVVASGEVTVVEQPDRRQLVKITTPKLQIWIDRAGGDIVAVKLPLFPVNIERPEDPYQLLSQGNGRTYIAQSGLLGPDGDWLVGSTERPVYRSDADEYELGEREALVVNLRVESGGLQIVKSFGFTRDDYLVSVDYRVENRSGYPIEARFFAQLKRDNNEPEGGGSFSLGPQPYLGAALTTPESRYEKLDFDDLDDDGPFRLQVQGGWIAFLQHYFLSAWIAQPEETNSYFARRRDDGLYVFGYAGPFKKVADGAVGEWSTRFYAGPKDQKSLEKISANLNLTVDYGFLWWIAQPLFSLLDWFYGVVGNWGFAIILLTVLVKAILYPLSAHSYKSMANMRRVGPQMKRLQERHADDRQKLSQEMMALYKKEKVNPLGGCLPMLLPMPIFIALYWVLFESVELRHAPFMLWINDLAAMDPFFILPLAMGASMFLQQSLSPAVGDPMQVRMMKMMPIMFTVLFLFFPAGLVLYWLVNNVLSIAQQWYVIRKTEAAQASKP
ncbi:MAG: membrane protein insertase YidC [Gammaproteobacteria bacterium]|nr:membrane protein insertase YidC [Gammaproteobacteria bacterium]